MANPLSSMKTEAVGVFDNAHEMHRTIEELELSGFARHQISVRGSDAAVKETFGNHPVKSEHLADNVATPRSAVVGREDVGVAQGVLIGACAWIGSALAMLVTRGMHTQGPITTIIFIVALATLAGGVIGALLARHLGYRYMRFFKKQADKTGLLLWVETPDSGTQTTAKSIFLKHGARDIHIHTIANVG